MVIARILHGSSIDRQGMLHAGDVICEVNGREVGSDPRELQELLKDCSGSVMLKVLPSYKDSPVLPQVRGREVSPISTQGDNSLDGTGSIQNLSGTG